MPVRHSIDIDKLENFRNFLKGNPDKVRLQLEAKACYEGQAGRSTVHVGPFALDGEKVDRPTRHYTFPFGAWKEVEETIGIQGATDRMEPVEMALAATAACLINSISFNTTRMGINADDLEITVRSEVDPRVLFAVKEPDQHPACLGTIKYDVRVTGDVSDDDLKTISKLCQHSPVHGLIAESIKMEGNVTRA